MKPISAILLATLCWAGAVVAQGPPACSPDVERFCAGVPVGGGRVVQCLRQHAAELSAECKEALVRQGGGGRGQARGPAWLKACEADLGKLCHGVERGGGRLVQCLQGHRDQLSPTCKTAFDGRPGAARAATPPATAPPAPAATAPPTPAAH